MKNLIAISIFAFSGFALAQECRVDLININNPRGAPLRTYTPARQDFDCSRAALSCVRDRDASRDRIYLACKTTSGANTPIPPRNDTQNPPRGGNYQAQRDIYAGEEAFSLREGKWVRIISYNQRMGYVTESLDTWRSRTTGVVRADLAIKNACSNNFCTNDLAFDTRNQKDIRLVAIDISERFVTETTDSWRSINSRKDGSELASLSGCMGDICVGDLVYNIERIPRAEKIYAIAERSLVSKTIDSWKTISVNLRPENLARTNGCTYQGRINLCVGDLVRQARDQKISKILAISPLDRVVTESLDSWRTLQVVNGTDLYPTR